MGKKDKSTVEEIISEAREDYDLGARLAGITKRERKVTVFTDEVTGEQLGGVERTYVPNTKLIQHTRRWGVRGEQDELNEKLKVLLTQENVADEDVAEAKAEAAELADRAEALEKKLAETSMTFTIRALPEFIMKDARRKAYRNLKLKPKGGLTAEEDEDVRDEYLNVVLSTSVTKWTDAAIGKTFDSLSLENARALKKNLLPEEWAKLEGALDELQARRAIGDAGTDSADF
ncbi:hypothetical protein [Microbacterium sp. zg-YB36]|uniref:hypothetical protein n=1 Tax=Microbacterium sp. zg-YB36 TaxID=2969407 RepID=UPI00214B5B62|nr:hypothetical protein [Microbacterium sp. zg-YB36]MDL5351101.1 hypothetical protein [Microbacterium sp. zg-YB36]